MKKHIYNKNCKTTCNNWQEQYEKYLAEEKCKQEKEEIEELSKPDNMYGLNPYACQYSRNRVYMNWTGPDRLNWGKPKDKK